MRDLKLYLNKDYKKMDLQLKEIVKLQDEIFELQLKTMTKKTQQEQLKDLYFENLEDEVFKHFEELNITDKYFYLYCQDDINEEELDQLKNDKKLMLACVFYSFLNEDYFIEYLQKERLEEEQSDFINIEKYKYSMLSLSFHKFIEDCFFKILIELNLIKDITQDEECYYYSIHKEELKIFIDYYYQNFKY